MRLEDEPSTRMHCHLLHHRLATANIDELTEEGVNSLFGTKKLEVQSITGSNVTSAHHYLSTWLNLLHRDSSDRNDSSTRPQACEASSRCLGKLQRRRGLVLPLLPHEQRQLPKTGGDNCKRYATNCRADRPLLMYNESGPPTYSGSTPCEFMTGSELEVVESRGAPKKSNARNLSRYSCGSELQRYNHLQQAILCCALQLQRWNAEGLLPTRIAVTSYILEQFTIQALRESCLHCIREISALKLPITPSIGSEGLHLNYLSVNRNAAEKDCSADYQSNQGILRHSKSIKKSLRRAVSQIRCKSARNQLRPFFRSQIKRRFKEAVAASYSSRKCVGKIDWRRESEPCQACVKDLVVSTLIKHFHYRLALPSSTLDLRDPDTTFNTVNSSQLVSHHESLSHSSACTQEKELNFSIENTNALIPDFPLCNESVSSCFSQNPARMHEQQGHETSAQYSGQEHEHMEISRVTFIEQAPAPLTVDPDDSLDLESQNDHRQDADSIIDSLDLEFSLLDDTLASDDFEILS